MNIIILIIWVIIAAAIYRLIKPKKSWRQHAIVLAAAYLIEMEKSDGDQEASFFKALKFRYSPDYINKAQEKGLSIAPNRNHSPDIMERFNKVFRRKEMGHLLPGLRKILMNLDSPENGPRPQENIEFFKQFPAFF